MLRFDKNKCIIVACFALALCFVVTGAIVLSHNTEVSANSYTVYLEPLTYSDIHTSKPAYTDYSNNSTFTFTATSGIEATYETESAQEFEAKDTSSNFEQLEVSKASGANKDLFDIADKNFIVYYGSQRVNPIFPLALANVETPGRADHNITWSALFPSRIVPIELLHTMDVTTVVSNPEYYKALSAECSTRDRGALQMSPTYGTGIKEINEKMSGTEKQKLSTVDVSAYAGWASGASDKPGDRFCVSDVCLRLSGSMTQCVNYITKNGYTPKTDMQLVAQCAMHHHSSGVWCYSDKNKSVGKWISGEKAYEWSSVVSSDAMLKALSDYAIANPTTYFIDGKVATQIYNSVYTTPMSSYANSTLVCTYPIKVLYAYIKLCMLYTS